jgi:hypothetical protein
MALPSYNPSIITAIAHIQEGISSPKFVIGGKGGSGATTFTMQKKGTSYTFAVWRSRPFVIGKPFLVQGISFKLAKAIAANMTITPVLGFDNGSNVVEGTVINSTNYTASQRHITLYPDNFANNVRGTKDVYLELRFSGSALVPIAPPIKIEIETERIM